VKYTIPNPFINYHSQAISHSKDSLLLSILDSLSLLNSTNVQFSSIPTSSSDVSISVRHDVDANLDFNIRFAELEYTKGLSGTYYVIVAPDTTSCLADYNLKELKAFVRRLNNLGHKVGLHSTAWSYDNPIRALEIEIDVYNNLLDELFSPTTKELLFTHHGFSSIKNVRLARLKLEFLMFLKYHRFFYIPRKVILSDSMGILSFPHPCTLLQNYQPYEICFHPQYWF